MIHSRGGKQVKVTKLTAYARCPDMVLGQRWLGIAAKYTFECQKHGPYVRTWKVRAGGCGCRTCVLERMRQRWDLTGQRFGSRTVISLVGFKSGFGKALCWNCRCDCGADAVVSGSALRRGLSTHCISCGQLAATMTRRLPDDLAAIRAVLRNTRNSAKYRKLAWELSDTQFAELTQAPCVYCGGLPSNHAKPYRGTFVYNGIDRADNTQGYTVKNSVSCCWFCNRMKREMTILEFASHIRKIAQHLEEQHHGDR